MDGNEDDEKAALLLSFKAKVALEAIRGDLTLAKLAAKHGIPIATAMRYFSRDHRVVDCHAWLGSFASVTDRHGSLPAPPFAFELSKKCRFLVVFNSRPFLRSGLA